MDYVHGGDVYRNKVEYDFSVNINFLGMPKGCLEEAVRGVELCGGYPDWKGEALCNALAEREGVERGQVILGNGAAELIYALCLCLRPKSALVPVPTFQEYEAAVQAAGGVCDSFFLREETGFLLWEKELSDFCGRIREGVSLVFLCNPNNPTGRHLERDALFKILEACGEAGAFCCVDECFLPFMERERELSLKGELSRFPHLIVLRAFTKIYGMPGLRLGYALSGNSALLSALRRVIQPWNTSVPAQLAGLKALQDEAFVSGTAALVACERAYLSGELSRLPGETVGKVYPSSANFILFQARPDLGEKLLERGILIRDCSNFKGLGKGYFRTAVRGRRENEELLKRISECFWRG